MCVCMIYLCNNLPMVCWRSIPLKKSTLILSYLYYIARRSLVNQNQKLNFSFYKDGGHHFSFYKDGGHLFFIFIKMADTTFLFLKMEDTSLIFIKMADTLFFL